VKWKYTPVDFYRAMQLCYRCLRGRNSVCRSVCPSVRMSHACFVTKPNNALRIFWYRTKKGNHSSFLTPKVVVGDPFRLKFALKVIQPLQKRRLWQISALCCTTRRNAGHCISYSIFVRLSVSLSVRPSLAGIVSKRMNVGWRRYIFKAIFDQ